MAAAANAIASFKIEIMLNSGSCCAQTFALIILTNVMFQSVYANPMKIVDSLWLWCLLCTRFSYFSPLILHYLIAVCK